MGIASVSADGVWTRGAAAQPIDSPAGISVPFGPARSTASSARRPRTRTAPTSRRRGRRQARGVGRARRHLVRDGHRRRSRAARRSIEEWTPPLAHAGPLGRPVGRGGRRRHAVGRATRSTRRAGRTSASRPPDGTEWTTETVAAHRGGASGAATPARRRSRSTPTARSWSTSTVRPRAVMAARHDGRHVDRRDGRGGRLGVRPLGRRRCGRRPVGHVLHGRRRRERGDDLAARGGRPPRSRDAKPGERDAANLAETTGVAVDDDGHRVRAWYDGGDDRASGEQPPTARRSSRSTRHGTRGRARTRRSP